MTVTYVQGVNPIWYIVGLDGLAAGSAQLFSYDSLTRLPKVTYQDPGGTEPNTNPIIFDLNGTHPAPYFELDSTAPNDLYFIQVFDSAGNFLWEADNYPSTGSGGGSDVTTYIPLQNFITNNQVINHIGDQAGPLPINLLVAPSNHKGFTPAQANPLVGTYGVLGPDIRFVKNNTNASDSLTFPLFALGSAPLTGDVTPVNYIRYQSNSVSGETYKSFQFPITQKVKNLSGQAMTFTLWAAVTSTPVDINIYVRQYYGSGTAATAESSSTRTLIDTYTLSSTWSPFVTHFNVPSVSGNSIGTPGSQTDDDAVYIQIDMPLDEACDVLFIKPCLFLGTLDPTLTFESYDQIDAIDSTARTGDVKTSLLSSAPLGWLPMNDNTIGNVSSGATTPGAFTFQLYATIYTSVSNTYAPVTPSRTAPGTTMANAIEDFIANKPLKLPLSLGRALAGAGSGSGLTPTVLGQNSGAESSMLVLNNLPQHTHDPGSPGTAYRMNSTSTNFAQSGTGVNGSDVTTTGGVTGLGSQTGVSVLQPATYFNVFIKL